MVTNETTTLDLSELFARPPFVLVMRENGKSPSVDLSPDGMSYAVIVFRSVAEAKDFLRHVPNRRRFRPTRLSEAEWIKAVRRYEWLSIFEPEAGGTVRKTKVQVPPVLDFLAFRSA
jgi:hypothetical protein